LCEERFPAVVLDEVWAALDVFWPPALWVPVDLEDFVVLFFFGVVGLAVVVLDGFFVGASLVELCPALAAGTEAQAKTSA
jgi:hypothetical protein